ncbi:hypothetical protein Tco_1196210, partial [Tanacetum coccineum]
MISKGKYQSGATRLEPGLTSFLRFQMLDAFLREVNGVLFSGGG